MYNLKVIKCGNRVEIYKFNHYTVGERGKEEEFYRFIERGEEQDQLTTDDILENKKSKKQNRIDNLNNSRNKIIRLIKCNSDMRTFITLTFAKETDYKQSKKYLNNLFNKLRKKYKEIKYLWVLEYGDKNNRLHYHLLCNIPIEINLCSSKERKSEEHKQLEKEFSKKYWKYGFVDIRALDQEGNTNIALYVATYIVKSLEDKDLEGYRVFGYSNKTLHKPIIETYLDKRPLENILEEFKGYKVRYNNNYSIGYTKDGLYRSGNVTYFDMEVNNENI
ncbi:rolling circle replication-associated protein [Clostridium sardiniense]|uniref:rolling circle replication-associated protein n=1 Tax=Clostridium sardiniense TaxID=29369 RepID=UPI00195B2531|nr:hypothetical protein [Clostridium sardiniense]MBM7835001.1 hypothetical protein [Clostridium sardiniense]